MTLSLQRFLKGDMNKIIRFAGILILTSIYCYAMSVVTYSIANFNIKHESDVEAETFVESVSSTFFFHTHPTEGQVNTFNNVLAHGFQNLFPSLHAKLKTIDHFFETKFTCYHSTFECFPLHYRKADLIFPFQYFW